MFTANAKQILEARYLLRNSDDILIETPEQLFTRVAGHLAQIEGKESKVWKKKFYDLMWSGEFLPNSPTLMNAGTPKGQLSACFVLPIGDSLTSIFTTLKNAALIHQSGGGTGFNFSKLRPKDTTVMTSKGKASGPLAFMKVYDLATDQVKQGGKRRGANMGILNIDHPDISDFLTVKNDDKSLRNFNISVGITDRFMYALEGDKDWPLINPYNGRVHRKEKASNIWQRLIEAAWKTGDPGLVFLDTINKHNPTPLLGSIESTNPCGEVPLLNYESCNLGSLNLTKMVVQKGGTTQLNWQKLEKTIRIAMRFLDNVITTNHYLLPKIKEMTLANRKVGLGIMGWAELLILMEIPYSSDKAVLLGEKLMEFIQAKSYEASIGLAVERGCFPAWEKSMHAPRIKLRNATCNSIAPTGTISVLANTSYSIEPLFALAYNRVGILGNQTQSTINKEFVRYMKHQGLWSEQLKSEVVLKGTIQHLRFIPAEVRKLFETSLEIPWTSHLLHQRSFQQYTDNAVSKTINLARDTDIANVSKIYKTAWEYGLKGITIYRDSSKSNQVLQKCGVSMEESC